MMCAVRGLAIVLSASVTSLFITGLALADGLPAFEVAGKTGYVSSPLNTLGLGAGFSDGPACTSTVAPGATQSWQGLAGTTTGAGSTGTFILQPGGLVQLGFGHVIFGVAASAFIPFAPGPSASIEVDGQVGARF
jgi:hypothetical protein